MHVQIYKLEQYYINPITLRNAVHNSQICFQNIDYLGCLNEIEEIRQMPKNLPED